MTIEEDCAHRIDGSLHISSHLLPRKYPMKVLQVHYTPKYKLIEYMLDPGIGASRRELGSLAGGSGQL